jgi:Zn-finger nucleic acid-binding protein
MNFIGMVRQEENSVELKYCERCGGLWLRRHGHDEAYCGRCRAQRAALLRTGRGRDSKPRMAQNPLQIDRLLGVAEMEVRP